MELIVNPEGTIKAVYNEEVDLAALGAVTIRRASHVEPLDEGGWTADLSPIGGPTLGPYPLRSTALEAELRWLEAHWLPSDTRPEGGRDEVPTVDD